MDNLSKIYRVFLKPISFHFMKPPSDALLRYYKCLVPSPSSIQTLNNVRSNSSFSWLKKYWFTYKKYLWLNWSLDIYRVFIKYNFSKPCMIRFVKCSIKNDPLLYLGKSSTKCSMKSTRFNPLLGLKPITYNKPIW